MNDKQLEKFISEIKGHEGYKEEIYLDTRGNPTCGWGHYLQVGSRVPKDVCELFFTHDIASTINDFYKIDKKLRDNLNPVRRRVICNMIFNLGLNGCLNFKKMWKAIGKQAWEEAGIELLDSKLPDQIGRRAFYLRDLLVKGEDQ